MVTVTADRLSQRTRLSRDWVAAAVLALVALVTRGIWFGDPVADFDEQIYSFIGWRMTQGDLPFADLWDRKPFGLFAIYALAHWLFGPDPIAFQIFAALAAFGGAWLIYLLSRALVDRVSATVAGALYLMLIAAYGSYSGQSEVFHVPLMLLMVWLVRDTKRPDATKRALIAMLVGGVALQIKYTVLPQCAFFGAWALYGQWRAGANASRLAVLATAFAVLGILPTALVAALYAWWGEFDAFWFANFVSFFARGQGEFGRFWPGHFVGIIPLVMLVVLGLYAAFRLHPPRDWRTYGFYAGWAVSTLATVLLPANTYLYYYGALAPGAVLIALPLIDRSSMARWLPAALLLAGMAYILNLPARYDHSLAERRIEARLSAAIAPYVGAESNCLYVFDGPAALYRTTGTCLPTRYVYPDHLNNALERDSLEVSQPDEIRRILGNRPSVLVTANYPVTFQCEECLALMRTETRERYRPLISASLHGRMITAWVRADLVR